MKIPVHLAAVCGMRRGEICALTWEDIDLEKGTISFNKALSDTPEKGVGYVVKSTKTTAGKRIIRPPKHVMEDKRQGFEDRINGFYSGKKY